MKSGIYAIRNKESGKYYVGSSKNITDRFKAHRHMLRHGKHHSVALQRSWNNRGETAFEFLILEECAIDLLLREQEWIDRLNASHSKHGYNTCSVAGTREGVPQPSSVAEKMRAFHLGKPKSAEHRAKISAAKKGQPKSEETKAKLREATIRQFSDPAARQAASERQQGRPSAFKGKKHTAESKAALSAQARKPERIAGSIANLPEMTHEIRTKISNSKNGQRISVPRFDPRTPTEDQIAQMKALRASGLSYAKIAKEVGRDVATVFKYVNKEQPQDGHRAVAVTLAGRARLALPF